MRARPGDRLLVFSGEGHEWSATVLAVTRDRLQAEVGEVVRTATPLPLVVECWCGLVRPNRFDWAIEKCTEAGVDVMRPLLSEYSARGDEAGAGRGDRWGRIAVEAVEQSGRLSVPVVTSPARFDHLLATMSFPLVLFDPAGKPWPEMVPLIPERGHVAVAVGPEGGFSPAEVAAAKSRGALVTSLGPNILRTETAAVAGVVLVRSLGR
jgi:16S rRNA (uracil1498-N3)-methyltransferase